jgi:hypothetical protein
MRKIVKMSAIAAVASALTVGAVAAPASAGTYHSGSVTCASNKVGYIQVWNQGLVRVYAPGDTSNYGVVVGQPGVHVVAGKKGGGTWILSTAGGLVTNYKAYCA